ncbi:MAG: iron-sulfur cluster assembly accessory protein [Acidobacteriota bacterium]|nr:iron-sulfur cluster assembly accessory protein [Blastocatellia bacterium]MDW8413270.1 iron-sulfur cluster assembly accessory protein [Acidobacteriota bacterium]
MNGITLTDSAAKRIKQIIQQEGLTEGGLRIGVKAGGCSGLTYVLNLETQQRPGDRVYEHNGAKLFVDAKSFLYLNGTVLDYKEDGGLMERGFTFANPNSQGECGCGESFSV